MELLELLIASYDQWSTPWKLYEFVAENHSIPEEEKRMFKELWSRASSFDLWNDKDLSRGSDRASMFLQKHYDLNKASIDAIVRAISYQWK